LKYFLTRRDYDRLLKACRPHIDKKIHHTNYYFDNDRLKLRKRRFGLRIRLLDKRKAVLTLKFPAKGRAGRSSVKSLKIRHEFEEPIRMQAAKAIIKGKRQVTELKILPIKVLKKAFPRNHLDFIYPLGAVETVRTIAKLPKSIEIELDRFQMFGKRFYELEVETEKPKSADKAVRNLLRENKIPYHPITKSKLGRFLELWKRSQQ
jgi:uncharacterized protein YjbK